MALAVERIDAAQIDADPNPFCARKLQIALFGSPASVDFFRRGEIQFDIFGAFAVGDVDFHDEQITTTRLETGHKSFAVPVTTTTFTTVSIPQDDAPPLITQVRVTSTHTVQNTVTTVRRITVTHIQRDYTHNAFGGGAGVNYYLTRNLGLGVEGDWLAGSSAINEIAGSLIYRFPFENASHSSGWAPYLFLGGGGQFDGQNIGFAHAGGGVEIRLNRSLAIFTDGRYILHDDEINYALFRLGVRVIF
jgi:hypothetical protein